MAKRMIAPENTAVIYARFSSAHQREESIEAQVRACKDYARRNGLQVINTYADSAKTGTNADREAFQQMIEDSSEGTFRYVIIHKLDRFSRDKYDSVTYKRKLKVNGVTLRSVLENLDGSPESLILESLLEGMAAYYSQNLSRESLKGQMENGYKCLYNGGLPPLGYDIDKATGKYVINEKEAEIVRYIFSQYAEGTGYNKIIAHLNGIGYRTKRGNQFGKNSLQALLKNLKYTGVYTFNLKIRKDVTGTRNPQFKPKDEWIYIEGGVPAIIDKETFDRVQTKLAENRENAGRFKTRRSYMLSGLVRCGECGSPMWAQSHVAGCHGLLYLNYECAGKAYKRTCTNRGIRKESIENYVLDELCNTLFTENSIKKLAALLNAYCDKVKCASREEYEQNVIELSEIKGKIEKIIQLVAESGISIDLVKDEIKGLEERKRIVEGQIKNIQTKQDAAAISEETLIGLITKSRECIESKNIPECRKLIGNYIESVIVHRDRVDIRFKIGVPDHDNEENEGLKPLQTSLDLMELKERYKKTG